MIVLLALLSAAATGVSTPAAAIAPASWIVASDYPREALIGGAQGAVVFRLSIDASGKPDACGILASSGSQALDIATCKAVLVRGRFKPAVGSDGKPVRGTFSSVVNWTLSEQPPSQPSSAAPPGLNSR